MQNTTAIQDLLIWIEEIENSPASLTFSETDFRTLSQFKDKISSKLEKEKSIIRTAFLQGFYKADSISAEQYYNNNFK